MQATLAFFSHQAGTPHCGGKGSRPTKSAVARKSDTKRPPGQFLRYAPRALTQLIQLLSNVYIDPGYLTKQCATLMYESFF
jgi:hypothetical protein